MKYWTSCLPPQTSELCKNGNHGAASQDFSVAFLLSKLKTHISHRRFHAATFSAKWDTRWLASFNIELNLSQLQFNKRFASQSAKCFEYCLSWGFIAVKRCHDHGNCYKGKHLIGSGLQSQRFSLYHHGRKHSSVQAEMLQETELRVLQLDLQEAGDKLPPTRPHPLQRSDTC